MDSPAAQADPDPTPGPGQVIHNGLPAGAVKVVLRQEIPSQLPGFDLASLPQNSAGVFVMTDGSTQPLPAGTGERLPNGKVLIRGTGEYCTSRFGL
jgi:hypothetical protein